MMDDTQLLRRYAVDLSESAFAELVQRHVNFVYSVALRLANGDAHLAQDATQRVFTDLARKALPLSQRAVLASWLFTSVRFEVSRLIRGEQRRRAHEREAHLMDTIQGESAAPTDWQRIRPVLDDALAELSAADREAVLLRFFEGLAFAGVGARLNVTENAARMRVERALDKLQGLLARRGLTSSTAALATVLASQGVMAAPAGLAAAVTSAALAGASAGGVAVAVASFMTMNKLAVGVAGAVIATGIAGYIAQAKTAAQLRSELELLRTENAEITPLQAENLRLTKVTAEVEAMKADDATLAQLDQEADALKVRLGVVTRRAAEAQARAAVYDVAKLDRPPRAVKQVRPEYPAELRTVGTEGNVVVDFVVDAGGKVRRAYAVSSTLRGFEDSAVAAVSQWDFEPGAKSGRSVNTRMRITIVYSLAKGGAVPGAPQPYSGERKP